jgi:hypothetical protein
MANSEETAMLGDLLQSVLGGGQQQQEMQDFARRYEQGKPQDGYSDQEVIQRYEQVASKLPPEMYQQAATEAFARLSPDERRELAQELQQRAQERGINIVDLNQDGIDDRLQDPQEFGRVATRMREQEPDMLTKVLSGKTGTMLDSPVARAALAGVAAIAVKNILEKQRQR